MEFFVICLFALVLFLVVRQARLEEALRQLMELYTLDKEEMSQCLDVDYDKSGEVKAMRFKKGRA